VIPLRIDTYVPNPQMYSKNTVRAATKAYYAAVGTMWANLYLPKHFISGNRERYGFAPRNAKYLERKRRLAKANPKVYKNRGEVDLVFLGRLARMATASARQNVRPFFNRVRITMNVPQISGWSEAEAIDEKTGRRRPRFYATNRRQKTTGVDIGKEMKAVTFHELREMKSAGLRAMNQVLVKRYGKHLYRRRSSAMAA
jgi:hypothetical protein